LVESFNLEKNNKIREIASQLPYRDFMTVGLLVKKLAIKNKSKYKTISNIVPDCWIYIQEREVKIGRLQIFNNWSPYLVADLENSVWLGLEYFCSENDELWSMKDEDFIKFASEELAKIGIILEDDILDSVIVRVKKAYPAYFGVYKKFPKVQTFLNSIDNLYCIGRNGQHRYNNMDHSILTGFEAARALINNTDKSNVWKVNTECEYHENKK
jgi:protoporphyrinogen oxidase